MFILKMILIGFTIFIIFGLLLNGENSGASYITAFYEFLLLLYLLFS